MVLKLGVKTQSIVEISQKPYCAKTDLLQSQLKLFSDFQIMVDECEEYPENAENFKNVLLGIIKVMRLQIKPFCLHVIGVHWF